MFSTRNIIAVWLMLLIYVSCSKSETKNTAMQKADPTGKAYYEKGKFFENRFINDSAYYYFQQAEKVIPETKKSYILSKTIYHKAIIDYRNSDLPASEYNSIKALEFMPKDSIMHIGYIYNLLGLIAKEKKEYTTAIEYFQKFRNSFRNLSDTIYQYIAYQNNMSNVYRSSGNNLLAIKHLDSILLIPKITDKYQTKYARTLDNKGRILLDINEPKKAKELFDKAYMIRKKNKDIPGMIMSHLNYSEYFNKINKPDSAKFHANQALKLSLKNKIPKDEVESYKKLAEVDTSNAHLYFNKYLHIKDSLDFEKQKAKDQTARIRYESSEKEKQIEAQRQIIEQKNIRNRWLLIVISIIFVALLIFIIQIYRIQRQNKIIRKQNEQLTAQNKLIETIYLEMHHRIKNNLDIINLVFVEQIIDKIHDKDLIQKLTELKSKIASIKNLHLLLQDSKPGLKLPLKKYVEKVIHHSQNTLANKQIKIINNINEEIMINIKQASPIGLIINEFIINSYKYAFDNVTHPYIEISAKENETGIDLILRDNGKGLPDNFDISQTRSQGLRMVHSILIQLKAKINISNKNGLQFIISIPKN